MTFDNRCTFHLPICFRQKLDLELIPIELQLRAWAKVFGKTVFSKCLWKWSCKPISFNLWTKVRKAKRGKPPQFLQCSRNHTAIKNECKVQQIPGRHPKDTAFVIEAQAVDDGSDLAQHYAVGSYEGGSDVVGFTAFQGRSIVVEKNLPNGIPLYWTVKARNTEGLEAISQCNLNTYDNTDPDGRVEEAYSCSSHPNTLEGSVMILDDSPLRFDLTLHALGYSPGPYGSEVMPWQTLNLLESKERTDIRNELRFFTNPREGKLTTTPLNTLATESPLECAERCRQYGTKCVSFDYEFHSETCDLHSVLEGPFAELRKQGTYKNYERLDVGFNAVIRHQNISIEHGAMYYINTVVTNTLGYRSVLSSRGTMVDFTPPEPNYPGLIILDMMRTDRCKAAVTQRCEDVTWNPNHR